MIQKGRNRVDRRFKNVIIQGKNLSLAVSYQEFFPLFFSATPGKGNVR